MTLGYDKRLLPCEGFAGPLSAGVAAIFPGTSSRNIPGWTGTPNSCQTAVSACGNLGGGTCITLEKVRLKLDREQNPTASEISRMESFVLRSRLQALVILVLFTKSRGDMPMISRKTRRKWVGLQ